MKRFPLLFLALLFLLLPTGCKEKENENENAVSESTSDAATASPEDDDYLQRECREPSGYADALFAFRGTFSVLRFSFPNDWSVAKKTSEAYLITRDGNQIGKLINGTATDLDSWKSVDKRELNFGRHRVEQHIERYGTGETLAFRYRYVFSFTDGGKRTLTLTVTYEEVNEITSAKLRNRTDYRDIRENTRAGDLSELADGRLLMLGNSFINSSQVGSFLNQMLVQNKKDGYVNAISRGYASVSTYAADYAMLADIRNGQYDAVFICGLYGSSDISDIGILKTACDRSDTRLILFPAHNEDSYAVRDAKETYDSLYVMNWQDEINALIAAGVDKWDFCVDDAHRHSTALAGYVGAHMIYRAIYGEVPNSTDFSIAVDTSLLGDYVNSGYIGANIHYFS